MKRLALLLTMIMACFSAFALTFVVRDASGRAYTVEASKYVINPPDTRNIPANFTGILPSTTTIYCTDGRVITVNTQTFLSDNANGGYSAPQPSGGSGGSGNSGAATHQTRQVTCPSCGGLGKTRSGGIGNNNYYRCNFCGGKGTVTR